MDNYAEAIASVSLDTYNDDSKTLNGYIDRAAQIWATVRNEVIPTIKDIKGEFFKECIKVNYNNLDTLLKNKLNVDKEDIKRRKKDIHQTFQYLCKIIRSNKVTFYGLFKHKAGEWLKVLNKTDRLNEIIDNTEDLYESSIDVNNVTFGKMPKDLADSASFFEALINECEMNYDAIDKAKADMSAIYDEIDSQYCYEKDTNPKGLKLSNFIQLAKTVSDKYINKDNDDEKNKKLVDSRVANSSREMLVATILEDILE
jgi:hypothetical protein